MLIDRYTREDVFAQVPELAAEIDPIFKVLDGLLDDDHVYRQVRGDFGKRYQYTRVAWASLDSGGSPLTHTDL